MDIQKEKCQRLVGWYESGKRKTKALPSKTLAEHFRRIKYAQLNSDVFTGTVMVDWNQMKEEYTHYKKVKGDKQAWFLNQGP